MKEDFIKKVREKGGEEEKRMSVKTHVKIPLAEMTAKKIHKNREEFQGTGRGGKEIFLAGQNIYP